MEFHIISMFPDAFTSYFASSIIHRATKKAIIHIHIHNLCDFSTRNTRRVDMRPYGGGAGTVLSPEPIHRAILAIENIQGKGCEKIVFTPRGKALSQAKIEKFAKADKNYILLCGHYEGIDQRVIDHHKMIELSIGKYVLTGGELPAMVFVDSITRLIPGVIEEDSASEESFSPLLGRKCEYPQYTRPQTFLGHDVPAPLLSGDPKQIHAWKETYL